MKPYKSFPINPSFDRKVCIAEEYKERVRHIRQTGGDHVVIYDLVIVPNTTDTVNLYYEDDEYTKDFCTHLTKECIPYISEGVEAIVEFLKEKEVSCNGFELCIANAVVHPVDFRPTYYRKFTTERLVSIVNKIASKELI